MGKVEAARGRTGSAQTSGGFGSNAKIFGQNTSVLFWLSGKLRESEDEFSFSLLIYDFQGHQEPLWVLKRLNSDGIPSLGTSGVEVGKEEFW